MLDILTEKGQISRVWEDEAVNIWHSSFPELRYIHTDKNTPAKPDAIIINKDLVKYVAEMKCRPNLSSEKFFKTFKGEWLVTHRKIVDCVKICELLHVPLIGMLYLVDEKILLYNILWSPSKGYIIPFEVRKTQTQATINGGLAIRDNAYINMNGANILR